MPELNPEMADARAELGEDRFQADFEDGVRWDVYLEDRITGKTVMLRRGFSSALAANGFEEWMLRWQSQDDVVMTKRRRTLDDTLPHAADRELELRILIAARLADLEQAEHDARAAEGETSSFGAAAGAHFIQKQIDAWRAEYRELTGRNMEGVS